MPLKCEDVLPWKCLRCNELEQISTEFCTSCYARGTRSLYRVTIAERADGRAAALSGTARSGSLEQLANIAAEQLACDVDLRATSVTDPLAFSVYSGAASEELAHGQLSRNADLRRIDRSEPCEAREDATDSLAHDATATADASATTTTATTATTCGVSAAAIAADHDAHVGSHGGAGAMPAGLSVSGVDARGSDGTESGTSAASEDDTTDADWTRERRHKKARHSSGTRSRGRAANGDMLKCQAIFGLARRAEWCKACRWKKSVQCIGYPPDTRPPATPRRYLPKSTPNLPSLITGENEDKWRRQIDERLARKVRSIRALAAVRAKRSRANRRRCRVGPASGSEARLSEAPSMRAIPAVDPVAAASASCANGADTGPPETRAASTTLTARTLAPIVAAPSRPRMRTAAPPVQPRRRNRAWSHAAPSTGDARAVGMVTAITPPSRRCRAQPDGGGNGSPQIAAGSISVCAATGADEECGGDCRVRGNMLYDGADDNRDLAMSPNMGDWITQHCLSPDDRRVLSTIMHEMAGVSGVPVRDDALAANEPIASGLCESFDMPLNPEPAAEAWQLRSPSVMPLRAIEHAGTGSPAAQVHAPTTPAATAVAALTPMAANRKIRVQSRIAADAWATGSAKSPTGLSPRCARRLEFSAGFDIAQIASSTAASNCFPDVPYRDSDAIIDAILNGWPATDDASGNRRSAQGASARTGSAGRDEAADVGAGRGYSLTCDESIASSDDDTGCDADDTNAMAIVRQAALKSHGGGSAGRAQDTPAIGNRHQDAATRVVVEATIRVHSVMERSWPPIAPARMHAHAAPPSPACNAPSPV